MLRIVALLIVAAAVVWVARRASGGRVDLGRVLSVIVAVLVAWVVIVLAFD
jgi:hypothetical protein